MVYLARAEDREIIITHEVTIRATIKEGDFEDFKRFIKEKIEKWNKVSIKSINFEGNIIETIIYTSEPKYFSAGTIIPPIHSPETLVVASSYLLRPLKAIENETSLYLCHSDLKLPKGIEIKEKMPEVQVKQVLFPKKGDKFIILY